MSAPRLPQELAPEERRALLARLLRERAGAGRPLPLSFPQRRLWFLDQLQPGSAVYNVARAVRLDGDLAPAALAAALGEVMRRHEVLRTVFSEGGGTEGEPVQVVLPAAPLELPRVDLTALPSAAEREAEARRLAIWEAALPFDLARGPLVRAALLRLGTAEHTLLLTLHHAVADAWSMAILFRELGELYAAFAAGRPSPLPPLAVQYAGFTRWQRERLQGDGLAAELAWWRDRLAGAPALLELPTDAPRPPVPSQRGGTVVFTLPAVLAEGLRALGRASRASLFMTLLAAYQALLSRLTGAFDLVVGTAVANRERPEWAELIGFFLNTLALRGDLSGDPSFRELLGRVREGALAAYAHAELPFELLVEELQPERRPSHAPLFQTMFLVDDSPPRPLAWPGLRVRPEAVPSGTTKFDLTLILAETGGELRGHCEYARDLFEAATVERFMGHWRTLLEGAVAEPDRRLSGLPLLTAGERRQLLDEWGSGAAIPVSGDVVSWFREQVARRPQATAVVSWDQPASRGRMSYAELGRRVDRLAARLRALGVGPDARVALLVGRGAEMPVAVLGALAAGGACMPLDPAYPPERIRLMLEDARASVLLTRGGLPDGIAASGALTLDVGVVMEAATEAEVPAGEPPARVAESRGESLVYVVYTSGSTGRPKGVAMSHRAIANMVAWQMRCHAPGPQVTLQFAALSFDVSFQEMFATWCSGGTMVLVSEELRRDPPALLDLLGAEGVQRLFLPVAALEGLAEAAAERERLPDGMRLREVITAGEQLRVTPQVAALFERLPGCDLVNHYGPSETHAATSLRLTGPPRDWPARPAIGQPIDNARTVVLDAALAPVPAGIAGELYIGGAGVGRGYLGRPDATAERFLPDPFPEIPGARLYRTGDRARVRAGGVFEYLGRADDQVKLRGFRIEPGEIEAALVAHPAVREAAVVLRESEKGSEPGSRRLVAYVVPRRREETERDALLPDLIPDLIQALRAHLAARLPAYMVPSAFEVLAALPLTPSGKVDRRALPEPSGAGEEAAPAQPPRTPVERELAAIWCEVLDLPAVGVDEDFFALGGHSLLATRVISRLRRAFGIDLPLAELFAGPTVERLAAAVEKARAQTAAAAVAPRPQLRSLPRQARRLDPLPEAAE